MANPAVTYTFSNSTTADATQVNQNFTDIIDALTDYTKSLSIDALTCAGAVNFQDAVTLGNGTPDDISFLGSLATSIPIKTTYSYDFGSSTIGLRSIYLGSADSAARTVRLIGSTMGSSYTMTLPPSSGGAGTRVRNNAGTLHMLPGNPSDATNYALSCSLSSNALTIALKGADGNDASASNPIDITFRNSTAGTGTSNIRQVTGALSLTISSGSTLGHSSGTDSYIYVYALDNSGTVELAASTRWFDEGELRSTTAEGGAGAADSATTIYSTTARTSVPIRLLGRLKSNQATAGTWVTAMSEISLPPFEKLPRVPKITTYTSGSGTFSTTGSPLYLRVRMAGGGGGGSGSSTAAVNNGTNGTAGGDTTFGNLTASGGGGGVYGFGSAAAGGTASIGSGFTGMALSGGSGTLGTQTDGSANRQGFVSVGGVNPFGGAGSTGNNSAANTGAGGGGGYANNWNEVVYTGGSGGAGGFIDAWTTGAPSSSYSYSVGSGGSGGTGNCTSGSNGGSGVIIIEEHYQ